MWLAVSHEAFQIDRFACVFAIAVRLHPRALTALAPFAASASGSARVFGPEILALRLPGMVSPGQDSPSGVHIRLRPPPSAPLLAERRPSCWRLSALPLQSLDCVLRAPHAGEPQACREYGRMRSPCFRCRVTFLPFPRADLAPAFRQLMPFHELLENALQHDGRSSTLPYRDSLRLDAETESRHEASKRFFDSVEISGCSLPDQDERHPGTRRSPPSGEQWVNRQPAWAVAPLYSAFPIWKTWRDRFDQASAELAR